MAIVIINAQDRFSSIDFGAGRDDLKTTYCCPNCSTKITFQINEFLGSLFNSNSCLRDDVTQKFDNIRSINKVKWEDFFDFKCDNCGLQVRVIYISNEFRMACHNFHLNNVLEYNESLENPSKNN